MISFTEDRIQSLFKDFSDRKILVVGDLMLDKYEWGRVSRISPEAPVPVVEIEDVSYRFGGAANVALNAKKLGAETLPVGVIGNDESGRIIKDQFLKEGFSTEGLVIDSGRPTTVKTRIIAHNQHVVRTDREIREGISTGIQNKLLSFIREHIDDTDGIILEDYNKGLLIPHLINEIISIALKHSKMIFVDPKFDHFFDYKKVTLFKPNRKEVSDKLGIRLVSDEVLQEAGDRLLSKLHCDSVLITLGEEGMALFEPNKKWVKIPTRAVKVHDVSGAGDTVIATMAVSMTSGANAREAATVANHAAGIVCGEVGIVPVDRDNLIESLQAGF